MRELKTADEVISDIAEVLSESDGESIQEIANMVLSGRVEYVEDSLFEVFWDEDDEDEDVGYHETEEEDELDME